MSRLNFSIELASAESSEALGMARALGDEVASAFGPRDEKPFALIARESGYFVGAIKGVIHWRWLYVAQFYVVPHARGSGVGRALLARAKTLALANQCVGIYLDTFSEAVCAFYQRRGFVVRGGIDNFPPGARRIFLTLSPLAERG